VKEGQNATIFAKQMERDLPQVRAGNNPGVGGGQGERTAEEAGVSHPTQCWGG
jgi:hypothetical protein